MHCGRCHLKPALSAWFASESAGAVPEPPSGNTQAGGAPSGRRLKHVRSGLPSVHLHLPGRPPRHSPLWRSVLLGAPASAASRGWSRVGTRLPCQDHRSFTHFYDGSSARGRPVRDRFVIFIEPAVHMSDRPERRRWPGLPDPRDQQRPAPASPWPSPPCAAAGRGSPRAGGPPPRAWAGR